MKFLIHGDGALQEELDGIANGLIANGNEVYGFHDHIYKANEEREPDYFIFTENTLKQEQIQDFLRKKDPKYLTVWPQQISFSDGNSINLPSFASTLKYKPQLPSHDLDCDVAICFDGLVPDKTHVLYNQLYRDYRVKIIGAFINCAGYIGLGSPADLMKLAKSARVTVSDNKVITNSLLYNNICAVDSFVETVASLSRPIEQIEEYVMKRKKDITTEIKLGKIICEELSNINR